MNKSNSSYREEREIFSILIHGIDYRKGLSMFAGDKKQYLLIIKSFLEEGRELSQKMCEELERQNFIQYSVYAHSLKGISANIGADTFSQQAKKLEMAAKEGRLDDVYKYHKEVIEVFETMAKGIDKLLAADFILDQKEYNKKGKEISEEVLLQKLKQIYKSLDGFYREEAKEVLNECQSYCLTEKISTCLKEIDRKIEQFQYEEPMQNLSELIIELQKQG